MKRLIVLLALAACTSRSAPLFDAGLVAKLSPSCAPDDGLDDRECLQALLDASCAAGEDVALAAGTWNLSRPPVAAGHHDNASLWLECGLRLHGVKAAPGAAASPTVLMMTGDGYANDWTGLRVSGNGGVPNDRAVIEDLTIASDASSNPNEQTHLLMLGSPATEPGAVSNVEIRRLTLRHPVLPAVSGDCLRFVGEAATPIRGVLVEDVNFAACDRSGIAVQRGVQRLTLRDLRFQDIGKTAIDLEPSGPGPIEDLDASGLDIEKGGVSLCGQGDPGEQAVRLRLVDSTIRGGLGLIYAADVEPDRLVVEAARDDDRGAVNIMASEDVALTRSTIRRLAAAVPGPAVRLVGHNGRFTARVEIERNRIWSETDGDVIVVESAQDVLIERNRVTYSGPTPGAYYGFFARATGQDVDAVRVDDNRFAGPLAGVTRLAGNPLFVRAVQLIGNVGPGVGLRCENPLKFAQPVVQGGGYLYGGAATAGCAGVTVAGQWP